MVALLLCRRMDILFSERYTAVLWGNLSVTDKRMNKMNKCERDRETEKDLKRKSLEVGMGSVSSKGSRK